MTADFLAIFPLNGTSWGRSCSLSCPSMIIYKRNVRAREGEAWLITNLLDWETRKVVDRVEAVPLSCAPGMFGRCRTIIGRGEASLGLNAQFNDTFVAALEEVVLHLVLPELPLANTSLLPCEAGSFGNSVREDARRTGKTD